MKNACSIRYLRQFSVFQTKMSCQSTHSFSLLPTIPFILCPLVQIGKITVQLASNLQLCVQHYPAYHPFCYQIVISIDNSRDESRRGFSWKIMPVSTKPDRYDDECQSFLIANLLPLHRPVRTGEWRRHSCPFPLPLSAGSFSIIRTFEKSEPLTIIPLCRRNYIFK